MTRKDLLSLAAGPTFAAAVLLLPAPSGLSAEGQAVAGVVLWMAIWWMTEAVPVAATALLPIVLYPAFGVMSTAAITPAYGNHLIYLFLGGFMIAMAVERWGLHERIALYTLRWVGVTPPRVLFGFMAVTAFLSMWVSNTATAMMMLTIALALLREQFGAPDLEAATPYRDPAHNAFALALMLGIAYAASIGGATTLIGTPPNAILAGVLSQTHGIELRFAGWMLAMLPVTLTMLVSAWWWLRRSGCRSLAALPTSGASLADRLRRLGRMRTAERRVLWVFLGVALAWMAGGLLPWPVFSRLQDSTIAIIGALVLFVLPAGEPGQRLLDWRHAKQLPWEVIVLFGGGFAIAQGFADSGLADWVGQGMRAVDHWPAFPTLFAAVVVAIFVTEISSNTATAALMLPLFGALALSLDEPPALMMGAVAVACSYAFMLPAATPPNAIVYGSGCVHIAQMARMGLAVNLFGALLLALYWHLIFPWVAPLMFANL